MSEKDALLFLKKITEDPLLTKKVKQTGKDGLVRIAEERGYNVTLEELLKVRKEVKGGGRELSDEDMEMIVGGISSDEIIQWTENNIDKLGILYDNLF